MKAEELLIPRYKVIADYPTNPYKLRAVIEGVFILDQEDFDKFSDYPHIFQKLEWWEERKLEDMPSSVMIEHVDSNSFILHKVNKWNLSYSSGFPIWYALTNAINKRYSKIRLTSMIKSYPVD